MDPLSFTASLVALSSLVGTFGKALKIIAQLKHANDEIANATNQLEIIQAIVDQIEVEVCEGIEEGQPACSSSRADFARIRSSILAATRSVVDAARALFPPSTSTSRRTKHLRQIKWIIKDRKAVDTLQIKLNHLGNLLTIALQAEAASDNKFLAPAIASFNNKQDLMYSHIVFIKDGLTTLSEESFSPLPPTPPSGDLQPASKKLMQACVMRSKFDIPGFMVQYYRSAGQRKYFSLLFGFKLPGAHVVFARLSGPAYTLGIPNFRIKVQHMVPEDSEIFTACKAGNVLQVRDALQAKRASLNDITTRNETVLTASCDSRNTELVEFLLNLDADPNQTCGKMQTSPLHVAFELHEPGIARKLLYHGADIDYTSARGWNVVHHLWQHQGMKEFSDEFFHMCSETGFSHPNTQDGSGWTCLHRAAAFGTARDIKALLKLGASLTMYTSQHAWTPIHVAAVMNNPSTLAALSAQVSAYTLHSPDAHGWTPLHLAVYREAEDTMRFLLKNGANPHAQSNITATWFPVGLENQILRPGDLALECGYLFLGKYADALRDAGWQVTTSFDGDDIYWDSQECLYEELPRYEKVDS